MMLEIIQIATPILIFVTFFLLLRTIEIQKRTIRELQAKLIATEIRLHLFGFYKWLKSHQEDGK